MPITRINTFQAQEGHEAALREVLTSILPIIASSEGCHSCQVLQAVEDPTQFVVLEVWEHIEAHQASVKNIPPERFTEAMQLLAGRPEGHYYHD